MMMAGSDPLIKDLFCVMMTENKSFLFAVRLSQDKLAGYIGESQRVTRIKNTKIINNKFTYVKLGVRPRFIALPYCFGV
jgi:hypothetical protein